MRRLTIYLFAATLTFAMAPGLHAQKPKKKTIYIGPRGGRYGVSENGNKVYERKSR